MRRLFPELTLLTMRPRKLRLRLVFSPLPLLVSMLSLPRAPLLLTTRRNSTLRESVLALLAESSTKSALELVLICSDSGSLEKMKERPTSPVLPAVDVAAVMEIVQAEVMAAEAVDVENADPVPREEEDKVAAEKVEELSATKMSSPPFEQALRLCCA